MTPAVAQARFDAGQATHADLAASRRPAERTKLMRYLILAAASVAAVALAGCTSLGSQLGQQTLANLQGCERHYNIATGAMGIPAGSLRIDCSPRTDTAELAALSAKVDTLAAALQALMERGVVTGLPKPES